MNLLSKAELSEIEYLLFNKARDIDVSIYNAIVDPSNKEFVLDSLMLYMTKDGGMGSGLHIDNYNPNASVYQVYEALRMLSAVGFSSEEKNALLEQIVNKLGNYLFNRCTVEDGLWNPFVKSNDDFAHSEEFSYLEHPYSIWGVHPTAAILGYILELVQPTKAYYKKALKQIGYIFAELDKEKVWNEYQFISFNALLGSLKKMNLFPEEQTRIEERLKKEAMLHLEEKEFNFASYLSNVELDSILQDKVNSQLDEILSSRASHGLWEHKKGWGSNRYPEADSAALKWIGAESVWNIILLQKYGRIEE
ncbi:MAG: hypothetical protein K2N65_01885 [Anaeroplasmataceae bacterium]|nr:hypothetical protein [Anaeroplasmataceae bacterium]